MAQQDFEGKGNGSEARAGAPREFASIAERHRPQIFRFLLVSLRDADLAETLTQECFLKAHRSWSSFRGDSSALTWLTRIAVNLQKDYWRNRRVQFWRQIHTNSVDAHEAGSWLPSSESSPEAQVAAREQVGQVWKAVERLRERQRTVFLLRYVEELEFPEIARATGLHEGTVKAHLSRALGKVRAQLACETPTHRAPHRRRTGEGRNDRHSHKRITDS